MSEMNNDPFEEKVRQALDKSAETLDQETLSSLNQIRQQALNTSTSANTRPRFQWALWGPVGGLVTAVIVAAMWVGDPAVTPQSPIDDLELLASEDDLELMEEIEFVAWLLEQENKHAG